MKRWTPFSWMHAAKSQVSALQEAKAQTHLCPKMDIDRKMEGGFFTMYQEWNAKVTRFQQSARSLSQEMTATGGKNKPTFLYWRCLSFPFSSRSKNQFPVRGWGRFILKWLVYPYILLAVCHKRRSVVGLWSPVSKCKTWNSVGISFFMLFCNKGNSPQQMSDPRADLKTFLLNDHLYLNTLTLRDQDGA